MATTNSRANRVAFGNKFGKGKTRADSQMNRELKRIAAYRKAKKK